MSTRQLLDQLLRQGQALARNVTNPAGSPGATGTDSNGQQGGGLNLSSLTDLLKGGGAGSNAGSNPLNNAGNNAAGGIGSLLSGFGGGALSGGAIGLLLGNKKFRKAGGKLAMYGGVAALGVLAYKAYGNWQKQDSAAPAGPPQTMDRLPAPEVEQHTNAVLAALIAAAKADGHIGPEERALLETELNKLSTDAGDHQWLEAELSKPLDPTEVAKHAKTPEMAAEMYLASVMIVDEESYMERAYLDELARQLKLDPNLKAHLEAQIKQPV